MKCPACNGTGKEESVYSCCGDDITGNDIDLCPTCLEHCGMEAEDCEQCGGTGELEEGDFKGIDTLINGLTDKMKVN